jgi:sugar O-acyltransferase (sialic acid O-acetyltransferase NeuD family)
VTTSSGAAGQLYLFGAGGHAKVILEILEEDGIDVAGLFDDGPTIGQIWAYEVRQFPGPFQADRDALIIAIGSNSTRRLKAESLQVAYGVAIHPSTNISRRVKIDSGTVVMAGVTINSETTIGAHCIINTSASIDHDCVVEDYAHVSPNVTLCGNVRVGEGSHVGAGAVVIPGVSIGVWATVGAGSVVIRDVPDRATVVGNPAAVLRSGV